MDALHLQSPVSLQQTPHCAGNLAAGPLSTLYNAWCHTDANVYPSNQFVRVDNQQKDTSCAASQDHEPLYLDTPLAPCELSPQRRWHARHATFDDPGAHEGATTDTAMHEAPQDISALLLANEAVPSVTTRSQNINLAGLKPPYATSTSFVPEPSMAPEPPMIPAGLSPMRPSLPAARPVGARQQPIPQPSVHELLSQGKDTNAEALVQGYRWAVSQQPHNGHHRYRLACLLNILGRHQESLSHHETAVGLRPNHARYLSACGSTLNVLNRHDEALVNHKKAVRLSPGNPGYSYGVGLTLSALGRHDCALHHFRTAVAFAPTKSMFHHELGNSFRILGNHNEALQSHLHAVVLDPTNATFRASLLGTLIVLQ